jgi:hypothetical protein
MIKILYTAFLLKLFLVTGIYGSISDDALIYYNTDSINAIKNIEPLVIKKDNSDIIFKIIGYRGIYIYDKLTRKTVRTTISNSTNAKIANIYVLDASERLVMAYTIEYGCSNFFVIYDMKLGKEIISGYIGPARIFPFYRKFLVGEYTDDNAFSWYIVDPFNDKKLENNLTRTLTSKRIEINNANINPRYNFLIGSINSDYTGNKTVFVSVSWNDDFDNVQVVPIIEELSGPDQYADEIEFSPSGNWMVWESNQRIELDLSRTISSAKILFYVVDTTRRTKISLPVSGGNVVTDTGFYNTANAEGIFVMHKKMGECFITMIEGKIVLFPLNKIKEKILLQTAPDIPSVDPTQILSMDTLGIRRSDHLGIPIYRYKWSRDFSILVCEDWENMLRVYKRDQDSLRLLNKWYIEKKCEFVEISRDGDHILTSFYNSNEANIWNLKGELLYEFNHNNTSREISSICYYSDEVLITASESGLVELKNLKENKSDTFQLAFSVGDPTSIDYSPSSNSILFGSEFGNIYPL